MGPAHNADSLQGDLPLSREVASRTEGSSSRTRTMRCPGGTRSLMARETATALQHSSNININHVT
jgi:hypothetical protein